MWLSALVFGGAELVVEELMSECEARLITF